MPLTGALDVFLRRGKAMKTWLFLAEFFVCGRAGPLLWQITPPVFAHSGTTGHSMLDTEEPLPSRTWHIPACFLSYWPQFGPLSFPSRQLLLNPCPHSPFSRREACPQESWGGKACRWTEICSQHWIISKRWEWWEEKPQEARTHVGWALEPPEKQSLTYLQCHSSGSFVNLFF